jgi:acetylglutamate kinase
MTDVAAVGAMLAESLPYIQRHAGSTVVVKYGGNAIAGSDGPAAVGDFAADVALLRAVGLRPVVVHGGGPQISEWMARVGIEPVFSGGLRVTDAATMEIVQMVLLGIVNPMLVTAINAHGVRAAGISGQDGGVLRTAPRDPALGRVGEIVAVDDTVLQALMAAGVVPVVATVGVGDDGTLHNVNADEAAAAIAVALGAAKLIYLTDVAGVRRDRRDPSSIISRASRDEVAGLVASGAADGGMIPKLQGCIRAVDGGVGAAHVLDGTARHSLLIELFTDGGIGTMITAAG